MKLIPELNTIVLLSHRHMSPKQIQRVEKNITSAFNWNTFIDQIKFHRLCNPVYHNLKVHFPNQFPTDILKKIKKLNHRQIIKGLKNTGEVIKLSAAFETNNVPALFFKGVCLSTILYNDPAARHSGDIDILISKTEITAAENALFSLGYERVAPPQKTDESSFKIYADIRFHTKYKSPDNTLVELHWRFSNIKNMFPVHFKKLWQQREHVSLNGFKIPILDRHHFLLFLLIHGSKHGWERLFWVKDIADFYSSHKQFDWDALVWDTKKKKIDHFAGEAFLLINQLYGINTTARLRRLAGLHVSVSIKAIHYLYNSKPSLVTILVFFLRKFFIYNRHHKKTYIRSAILSKYYSKRLVLDSTS